MTVIASSPILVYAESAAGALKWKGSRVKADPNQPRQIGAPNPDVFPTVALFMNRVIAKGGRLLLMDAMKMQSTVYSPVAGKATQFFVQTGQHVEAKDLPLAIE